MSRSVSSAASLGGVSAASPDYPRGSATFSAAEPPSPRRISKSTRPSAYDRRQFTEAALLLSLWSLLVTNEGVIRFILHGLPSAPGLFTSSSPNRFAGPFLGGLFEVTFGLLGLAVGLSACFLDHFVRPRAIASLAVQNALGWHVFTTFVFILPGLEVEAREAPVVDGLSLTADKAAGVLGILASASMCLALQGGQFLFLARLIAFSTPTDFCSQRTGTRMRAIFWNANLSLAGLWMTAQASVIVNGAGAGLLSMSVNPPPALGRIPVYLLYTGVLMLIWPLVGVFIVLFRMRRMVRPYAAVSFFVFVLIHVHFTIGQMGFLADGPGSAGPAARGALGNGLVFVLGFLGPFFMLKEVEEAEEAERLQRLVSSAEV